jgi:hypothetical protein
VRLRLKDIDESAYLCATGVFSCVGSETESNGYRNVVYFILEALDDMAGEDMRKLFRSGKALVEPKAYASKQLELRRVVRERLEAARKVDHGGPARCQSQIQAG